MIVAAAIVSVLAGAVWYKLAATQLARISQQISLVEQAVNTERQKAGQLSHEATEYGRMHDLMAVRSETETPCSPTAVLSLLCKLLPDSVALTKFSVEAVPTQGAASYTPGAKPGDSKGAKTTLVRVDLQGIATSDLEVARAVSILARHRLFSKVTLTRSSPLKVADENRFAFQIKIDIAGDRRLAVEDTKGVAHAG